MLTILSPLHQLAKGGHGTILKSVTPFSSGVVFRESGTLNCRETNAKRSRGLTDAARRNKEMMKEFKNSLHATMPLLMVVLGFAVAGPALSQSCDSANGSATAKNIVEAPSGKLPPLEIAQEGYVFAGGKYSTVKDTQIMSGQIYAEFQIPAHRTHRYPIVFIHAAHKPEPISRVRPTVAKVGPKFSCDADMPST
jgi:hypothetical protein